MRVPAARARCAFLLGTMRPSSPTAWWLTQDAFIEGVHWDERFSGADVGWRLAMANLSDLNAMGARGVWAMLSIALPKPLDRSWVEGFSQGFSQALNQVASDRRRHLQQPWTQGPKRDPRWAACRGPHPAQRGERW